MWIIISCCCLQTWSRKDLCKQENYDINFITKIRFLHQKIFLSDKFIFAPYDKGMVSFIHTKFLKFNKGKYEDHEYICPEK